jgi:transposase
MNLRIVGIDIAKSKFDIAIKTKDKFKTKIFSNSIEGFTALL